MWRTPEALIDVTLQPVVFLALFTYIFGGAIAGGSQQEYLQFLLPGMVGQLIAMASVSIGVNLNQDIEKGVFDRFRSLPISRSAPLVGAVMADVVRYLILFVVTMGVGLLMGFQVGTSWLGVLAALGISMAFALCFAWISVFVGMIARTSGAVQGIMFLLVLPLGFASNTYVPTSTLPSWMQTFVSHNPITYLVSTRPWADGRWTGRREPHRDPRVDGRAGRGVRPAGPLGLPAPRLNRRLNPADLVGLQRLGLRHVQ